MPWTWDARIEEHPAGESSLRDFKGAFGWSRDDKGRRSGGTPREVSMPAPSARKRPPKVGRERCAADVPCCTFFAHPTTHLVCRR